MYPPNSPRPSSRCQPRSGREVSRQPGFLSPVQRRLADGFARPQFDVTNRPRDIELQRRGGSLGNGQLEVLAIGTDLDRPLQREQQPMRARAFQANVPPTVARAAQFQLPLPFVRRRGHDGALDSQWNPVRSRRQQAQLQLNHQIGQVVVQPPPNLHRAHHMQLRPGRQSRRRAVAVVPLAPGRMKIQSGCSGASWRNSLKSPAPFKITNSSGRSSAVTADRPRSS